MRLAEPEDATASEEPAAKKAKAQADNDSKPSPTRAGNGKARLVCIHPFHVPSLHGSLTHRLDYMGMPLMTVERRGGWR